MILHRKRELFEGEEKKKSHGNFINCLNKEKFYHILQIHTYNEHKNVV